MVDKQLGMPKLLDNHVSRMLWRKMCTMIARLYGCMFVRLSTSGSEVVDKQLFWKDLVASEVTLLSSFCKELLLEIHAFVRLRQYNLNSHVFEKYKLQFFALVLELLNSNPWQVIR